MLIIGLTGPSGAGKGTFAGFLPFPRLDTDKTAREVVKKGMPCLDELCAAFGSEILLPDGELDRKALGALAFSDKERLATLNRITHRYISEKVKQWLEKCKKEGASAAIIDAPQLFESGEDALCDITVAVLSDSKTRLSRILLRDGVPEEYARARMASQKPDEFFREHCTYVIENNGTEKELQDRAESFAKNVLRSAPKKESL